MRIALLGTRGIPANYGGFETFAEELSVRLVERGHEVTVYCRGSSALAEYRGVKLRYLPTIRHKYLDTLTHTALSTADVLLFRGFEFCCIAMPRTPFSRYGRAPWAWRRL